MMKECCGMEEDVSYFLTGCISDGANTEDLITKRWSLWGQHVTCAVTLLADELAHNPASYESEVCITTLLTSLSSSDFKADLIEAARKN